MQFHVTMRDGISPQLAKLARACAYPREILVAIGLQVMSLTKRAFTFPELRPQAWAPVRKKKGKPLRKSGTLWHSIAVIGPVGRQVTVASDRTYAAVHQFGASIKRTGKRKGAYTIRIPARPFFPFRRSGAPTARATTAMERAIRAALRNMLPK